MMKCMDKMVYEKKNYLPKFLNIFSFPQSMNAKLTQNLINKVISFLILIVYAAYGFRVAIFILIDKIITKIMNMVSQISIQI